MFGTGDPVCHKAPALRGVHDWYFTFSEHLVRKRGKYALEIKIFVGSLIVIRHTRKSDREAVRIVMVLRVNLMSVPSRREGKLPSPCEGNR
jgi:hypothetical protein